MFGLDLGHSALLLACMLAVCVFEFINGFHDTANAVATVIYTKTLKPTTAVIYSATFNAMGVLFGGIAVAMGIISMLPVETLVSQSTSQSLGMIGAILITAIFWNFGTWYLGIPASSTHTLVGAILGCGIAYGLLPGSGQVAVNWTKAADVGLSLLISPLIGFLLAVLLMGLLRWTVSDRRTVFRAPKGEESPPFWVQATLIATCGLVSYSHGSNDGQKGIGLMMLVLIGIVPAQFALSDRYSDAQIGQQLQVAVDAYHAVKQSEGMKVHPALVIAAEKLRPEIEQLQSVLEAQLNSDRPLNRFEVRRQILMLRDATQKLSKGNPTELSELRPLAVALEGFRSQTDYAPLWVIVLIAISIGCGTMIGWKRIVVTIGEKIGKTHLTYAQGASAELVAAGTIAMSTQFGLPVSTTQVLSSGIAGSMFASGGFNNLQKGTISKILLAWVLTFPVCLTMSGTLYLLFRSLIA